MQLKDTTATKHTLSNGLTIILEADATAPVVSTQLWVETGSKHEGNYLGSGISHLVEHMVFKGTQNYDGDALSQEVQAKGGSWNAYTSNDRTVYYIDGPSDSTAFFIDVLLEMGFKPSFPVEEFEKEKDVIRREIDMGNDSSSRQFYQEIAKTIYTKDDRRHPVIGHLELFNKLTHEDMLDYHRSRYTTENAFLCISGNIDKNEILEILKTYETSIPRHFIRPVQPSIEPKQLHPRKHVSYFKLEGSQFAYTWQIPEQEHPDSPALELAGIILGYGLASRLYQRLRNEKKLCDSISAGAFVTSQSPGEFYISGSSSSDKLPKLEREILAEIELLLKEDLSEELKKAKRQLLSYYIKSLSTASSRASNLAENWMECRDLNQTQQEWKIVEKIKQEDIRNVVQQWLITNSNRSTIYMHPEEEKPKNHTSTQESEQKEQVEEHQLSNGIKVLLYKENRLPLVSMQAIFSAGKWTEKAETAGLRKLFSTVWTKGAGAKNAEMIAAEIDSCGASLSASHGNNTLSLSASCLEEDTEKVVDLMMDCLKSPHFDPAVIEREKAEQLKSAKNAELDPGSLAAKHSANQLFGNQGLGISNLGSEKTLESIQAEDLKNYHQQFVHAGEMTLAIFGAIDSKKLLATIEKGLESMPRQKITTPPKQPILAASKKNYELDKTQAVLMLSFPTCGIKHEDRYALQLLEAWCSDMSGPLFTQIREELGLAYFVSCYSKMILDTGSIHFYLGTSPEQIEQAKEKLYAILAEIAEKGMDENALERVKMSWKAKEALANQNLEIRTISAASDYHLGFGLDYSKKRMQQINAITTAEIQKIANKYWGKQQATEVIVQPPRSA